MTPASRRNDTHLRVHDLIATRWSPRGLNPEHELTEDELEVLLDAARWAPSAMNLQPWRFLVARRGTPEFDAVAGTLTHFNAMWAPSASALMVAIAETKRDGRPIPNAAHDVGQAVAFLALQATAMGLVTHQMAGFEMDALREAGNIRAPFEPRVVIAVGEHDNRDSVLPEIRERDAAPRERLPIADIRWTA